MNTPLLQSSRIKITLVVLLILLAGASFVYNQILINRIMDQERRNVELWAKAFEHNVDPIHQQVSSNLNSVANLLEEYPSIPDSLSRMIREAEVARYTDSFISEEIIQPSDLFNIPVILADESGFVTGYRFIEDEDADMTELIEYYKSLHEPIVIELGSGGQALQQYVYYGESPMVRYLRFFPYVQFGILALLLGVGYTTYKSITRSEQSNLWVGMTKEAAHQMGTPLSSIYGWLQLLKDNNKSDRETLSIAEEIENDVSRLKGIADRFNKIGSQPELKSVRPEPILDEVISYMKRRLPQLGKTIRVEKKVETNAVVNLNVELFQWAIENLIKNAMDAIRESGPEAFVSVMVKREGSQLILDVADSGSGIDRKYAKEIFKPGYSTKKRGWGLGLSLTKRIIEDYHKGKVYLHSSEPGKGTVIRITLPLNSDDQSFG